MSLRERLNSMGIDGHLCEALLTEYLALVRIAPDSRMNIFLKTVRDAHV